MANRTRIVREKLLECHVLFPGYSDRSKEHLEIISRIFEAELSRHGDDEIAEAFDAHRRRGKAFPLPSDILDHLSTVTAYRMDHGPLGWGGLYAANHPYVRLQVRCGVDLSRYAVEVPARDHAGLKTEAACSTWRYDDDDAPPTAIERAPAGLARIGRVDIGATMECP